MRFALSARPRIVGIVGNPRPQSRTLQATSAVAQAMARATRGEVAEVIDLIAYREHLFDIGAPEIKAVLERVLAAEVLVVSSPVYKATVSSVLKAFFDHVGAGELAGRLAIPVMVGGAPGHMLAVETHMRPMLVEVGATCATPGLYILESLIDTVDAIASDYVGRLPL